MAVTETHPLDRLALGMEASVGDALRCIESTAAQAAFVVDSDGILRGVVTHGDFRRHVQAGGTADDPVTACMNKDFRFLGPGVAKAELKYRFGTALALPRLDERGRLVEVVARTGDWVSGQGDRDEPPTLYDVLWQRAASSSADYVESKLDSAMLFKERQDVWRHALSKAGREGLYAEFGVYYGESINFFAKAIEADGKTVFGFDSFEGLKEDWSGYGMMAGAFSLYGRTPKVQPNVTLVKGWFDQTLPQFLADHPGDFAFVHLDADTFASTEMVLNLIGPRLSRGTVIVFDEYLGFPNWRNGEFLAWRNCVQARGLQYRYLAFSPLQAVVQVL